MVLLHPGYVYRLPKIGDLGEYGKSTLHTGTSISSNSKRWANDDVLQLFLEFESDREVFNEFGNASPRVNRCNRRDCYHIRASHKLVHSVALLQVHNLDCST